MGWAEQHDVSLERERERELGGEGGRKRERCVGYTTRHFMDDHVLTQGYNS